MSWKIGAERGRPRPPLRLAVRLAIGNTASAFAVLLAAMFLLDWGLARHLDDEDDDYLREKVTLVRSMLREHPPESLSEDLVREASPCVHGFVVLAIECEDKVIAESPRMSDFLPVDALSDADAGGAGFLRGFDVVGTTGLPFRVLSASARSPQSEKPLTIHAALERSSRLSLLSGYRKRLATALAISLVACWCLAYFVARRGLAPLERIADTMRRTRSENLHERIVVEDGLPEELAVLATTFNEMLAGLEEAFTRLSRFSADIAHELRTPIANMRGEVEVALGKARGPEEYREVLGSCLEECIRISRLVERLLFIARAEEDGEQLQREAVEIRNAIQKVLEFYAPAAGEAGITLHCSAAGGLTARLDRILFQRVLSNLVENAIANTPPGGSIEVSATSGAERLTVEVRDTGHGIPKEHVPHLFDRFYRVDGARSRGRGGAGLGLAIVRSIVQLHGGIASIESEPGVGTRVLLEFPTARIATPA